MMANRMEINDSLFLKSISCPLKLYHAKKSTGLRKPYLPFKQRNKLQLRNAVALQYPNIKFTSDSVSDALLETQKWLKEDDVAICGAVIRENIFLTRIPILVKNGSEFTIVQIHGKLKKRIHQGEISVPVLSKTTAGYLVKAAYRMEVLRKVVRSSKLNVELFFPDKRYSARMPELMQQIPNTESENLNVSQNVKEELASLFTKMEATEATESVRLAIPDSVAHSFAAERSVRDVMKDLVSENWSDGSHFNVEVHQECSRCKFRKPESDEISDCWGEFFSGKNKTFPNEQVFELIGHGNQELIEAGKYFQEDVPLNQYSSSFEEVKRKNQPAITIQQRRELQFLSAHQKELPSAWVKPSRLGFESLSFPLHFIDFEAATYALPMQRGGGAYSPIYFQYSCHSLFENGEIVHHEWLDDKVDSGYPHVEFIRKLGAIDSIFEGSLIQYSPFESQALRYLLQEMERNSMLYENEIRILKNLLYVEGNTNEHRIFDLSKSVREGYYNRFMSGSIGLKQILKSVLQLVKYLNIPMDETAQIFDTSINFGMLSNDDADFDPYRLLQHPTYQIDDGEATMNAYISLKSNLLTPKEIQIIPTLMRRYCAMDSYALYIIYSHINKLINEFQDLNGVIIDQV